MSKRCCASTRRASPNDAGVRLHVLAVGTRVSRWVNDACADYQQRFPPHCPLSIEAVPAPKRGRHLEVSRLKEKEFRSLSARVPDGSLTIVLEEKGRSWTTNQLAARLKDWMHHERDVVFMIGGPDGLAPAAVSGAREKWSLSTLTLPHALVRVIVVEQLYRAFTILSDHPYHLGH